jgi:hypothetical protein
VRFSEVDRNRWNDLVCKVPESTFFHSWDWLNFTECLPHIKDHSSFLALQNEDAPLAICPLALTEGEQSEGPEMSLAGIPLAAPALANVKPSVRRQLMDAVFSAYDSYRASHGAVRIKMASFPLRLDYITRKWAGHQNTFEFQKYNFLYMVINTLVVDLSLPKDELFQNISKYHRRHIKRSKDAGLEVLVINDRTAANEEIHSQMMKFRDVHITAAGRSTQPMEAWESMVGGCLSGNATLFASCLNGNPISYLYCGEFSNSAIGWSQANLPEFEREYSPRHSLEWSAVQYYKRRGFQFYEFGERFFEPQLFHVPSDKEMSISEFKERYGGFMLPKIYWTGYFNNDLLKRELSQNLDRLLQSLPPCLQRPNSSHEDSTEEPSGKSNNQDG